MQLFVPIKLVPDTVEELEIDAEGRALDEASLRFKPGDADEHALEQALLLKESVGGSVTVVGLEAPEIDDVLYAAKAKGADRAVRVTGAGVTIGSRAAAAIIAAFLAPAGRPLASDALVLMRGQSIDDLEGEIGAYLAGLLGLPYLGVVTAVAVDGEGLVVTKEFSGGLRGVFRLTLPAVLGVQSAEKPPRYVPIAKVRAAMKAGGIESVEGSSAAPASGLEVRRMFKPESGARAQMLEGSPEEVADRLSQLWADSNLI